MDNIKFWQAFWLTLLLFISNCGAQQNSIFNQNQYRRPLQQQQQQNQFSRLQSPFATQLPSLLGQQNYQGYNQYNSRNVVPITSYINEVNYDGSFQYGYSAGDGTTAQAQGFVKNAGRKDLEAQVVQGSYSYTSPEGTPIRVTYIADENGFRAEGAHLPTSPPIPDAIAKSLNYISRLQPNQPYNQNIDPNLNPNLNPYQTPFRQSSDRRNQFNPLQLQQQSPNFQQQQRQLSGQFPSQNNAFNQQQRPFDQQFPDPTSLQHQQQQQQQQHQQQPHQQQHQQQDIQQQQNGIQQQQNILQQQLQQQNPQQQLLTQQLQGRPNQLIPNQFGYNKFRRYKKNTQEKP